MLLANGASVEAAIQSLEEVGSDEAIGLIRQVQSEHRSELAPERAGIEKLTNAMSTSVPPKGE